MFELPTVDYVVDELETQKRPPEGLRLRPYAGEADIPVIVEIANRELEDDGVSVRESVRRRDGVVRPPERQVRCGPRRDDRRDRWVARRLRVAQLGRHHARRIPRVPQRRRACCPSGDGAASARRSWPTTSSATAQLARAHQTDRPRILGSFTSDRKLGAHALLRSFGFEQVRWFFEMTRDLSAADPRRATPRWPGGATGHAR